MSDEAAIDWFKRDNEALRSALASSQEREARLRGVLSSIPVKLHHSDNCTPSRCVCWIDRYLEALSAPSDAGRGGDIDEFQPLFKIGDEVETVNNSRPLGKIRSYKDGRYTTSGSGFSYFETDIRLSTHQPPPASGEKKGGEA